LVPAAIVTGNQRFVIGEYAERLGHVQGTDGFLGPQPRPGAQSG